MAVAEERHSVSSSKAPMITMLATLADPSLSAISEAGMQTTCAWGIERSSGTCVAPVDDGAAGGDLGCELTQRRLIHRDKDIGAREHWRSDPLFRQADVAVRAARAHLRAIGGQPADFQALAHAHLCQKLAKQQNALSTESGDLDAEMIEVMISPGQSGCARGIVARLRLVPGPFCVAGHVLSGISTCAIAENFEREVGNHLLGNPLARFHRIFTPDRGAWRKNFDEGEAGAGALQFERFPDGAPRFHDVLVVRQRHALDVDRRFQRREHLRHMQRESLR